jgi:hypothetical protein
MCNQSDSFALKIPLGQMTRQDNAYLSRGLIESFHNQFPQIFHPASPQSFDKRLFRGPKQE